MAASVPNALWSMDSVSDALFDSWRLRALTVVDACTREALVIEGDSSIKGEQVVEAVSRITAVRGAHRSIRVDNGPEFVSKALDRWAEPAEAHAMRGIVGRQAESYENGVTLDLSTRQADRQRFHRVVQRPASRRVPERPLVPVAGQCPGQDRGLATGLQREPASHIAWLDDASRIGCGGGPKSHRMNTGYSF